MTSVVSPISTDMSPFSSTFIEDTASSLDSTLELSFDSSHESHMEQLVATTLNSIGGTNAPPSIATIQEVRTMENENEGILRDELVRKLRKNSYSC